MDKPTASVALAILETVADPVFVKDRDHVFLYVNDACCRLLGMPREEIVGRSDRELLPPHEVDVFWEMDAQVFRTGETNVNEENITVPGGETRCIVTKKSILESDDGPVLVGVIQDITERTRAEAELSSMRDHLEQRVTERTREVAETREKLYQAERISSLGALTGGMAHDFNNLLSIILMANQALLRSDRLSEEDRSFTVEAVEACRRGRELTRALLAYTRSQPLQSVSLDVVALVEETMTLLNRTLGTHTRLVLESQDRPMFAVADRSLLQNAFVNICVNARDAMPNGGRVFISCRLRDGQVEVDFRDEGTGIPPEVLPRIFDPFFTTKTGGSGSGLGLSSVHGFVHQSGGSIDVTTEVGRGTVFHLRLPEGRPAPEPPRPAPGTESGPLQVLVVDDLEDLVAGVVRLAQLENHRAEGATNVSSAARVSERLEQLDVVVTDVVLGAGELGMDVVREVRARHPNCGVVYMSGHDRRHLAQTDSETAGIFLRKPFTQAEFVSALDKASRGNPGQ